ncbi:MAG: lipoate--protein ligase family protein [Bythopirellula sp.]
MRHLPLTLETPAENLALDEALLDAAEADEAAAGILRLWEPTDYFVVLGRSSSAQVEVNLAACRRDRVPVLRRSSGGGTILAGPGCLMYGVVVDFETYPQLQKIDVAHQFVLSQLASMLTVAGCEVLPSGTSDLAMRESAAAPWRKFSGNALRLKRRHLLYHGTLLYDFDLPRISRCLASPTRTPEYRQARQHGEFVTNFPAERDALVKQLLTGWRADDTLSAWPQVRTANLVLSKYTENPQWVIYHPAE